MKKKKSLKVFSSAALAAVMCASSFACATPVDFTDDAPITEATPVNTETYNIPNDYARTYYEVFVRSFADGNGDGIGDIRGLINNLDYLNDGDDSTTTDLGINGIWLMPINPSNSYHKYDVKDYYAIDPEYGTLEDFDELVAECKKRGIWIQMDLVLNHTSNHHPDFLQAVADVKEGKTPETSEAMAKYCIYSKDSKPSTGTYYQIANSDYYYLANFSQDMPDVNLKNESVRTEIKNIVDFWLTRGVRSFRLDAVPWALADTTMYTDENGEFWTWFNDYCDKKGRELFSEECPDLPRYCYNVGEVWAAESIIKPFYATHMSNFNYSMGGSSSSLFASPITGRGNAGASSIVNSLVNVQKDMYEEDPESKPLLSNFLSNHDNDRSAGYFSQDPLQIKKAAAIYLLSPGNAYIYYGEEIGAAGSGNDPNKRLPFNWGDNRTVTQKPPQANYSGTQMNGSVVDQTGDAQSILTFYRNAIKLRNRFPEIARGIIEGYALDKNDKIGKTADVLGTAKTLNEVNEHNKTVAVYTLTYNDSTVLIAHNIGEEGIVIDAEDFKDKKLVGSLKAASGKVAFEDGKIILAAGTTAVIK